MQKENSVIKNYIYYDKPLVLKDKNQNNLSDLVIYLYLKEIGSDIIYEKRRT